jgi:hypothetical protein
MPGLFGGGNSGGTTNQQPAAGSYTIYQPQNQPGMDQSYQNLVNSLYGQATAGLPSQTPASAVYPATQQIAGTASYLDPSTGAYGFGGPQALTSAENASYGYESLYPQLQGINQTLLNANMGAVPQVQNAAFSPYYGSSVSNIVNNPYFNQAMSGAQTGADQGMTTAANAFTSGQNLNTLAGTLPGQAQSTAATTTSQIPLLQSLSSQEATLAPSILNQIQGLSPQLQDLFKSIVPQLTSAASTYANKAQATDPALQAIGATGQNLAAAAPGLAATAEGTSANMLRDINQAGKGLIAAAPGLAGNELGLNAPLAGAESSILQAGMDPRGALYNRTLQQITDQQNAQNAMSGVGTSPYGAGVTGQAQRNFNIDWQNAQLQRQATADQVAQGLSGQQAANITGAGNLLSGLTTAGSNLGLGVANQRLANTQAGANILSGLTTAGGNLGLGAAANLLNNTTAGGNLYGNLLSNAATTGGNLTNDQINAALGGSQAFNNLAAGAGNLAGGAAALSGAGLSQILAGAAGAGNLATTGANLGAGASALSSAASAQPSNLYQTQQQNILNALGQQTAAAATGTSALGNLTNQALGVGDSFTKNLANTAAFGSLPQQTAQQQEQNALNALTQQVNLGNQNYALPQQVINDLQSYLTLGQSASAYGGNLANLSNQAQAGNLQSIGTLGALASPALFGSTGLGLTNQAGLLGTGTSGLFGSGGIGGFLSKIGSGIGGLFG